EYNLEKTWSNEQLPGYHGAAIGILGGTFDPVHLGHLHVALSVYHALHLKTVQLMPSYQSPLRSAPVATVTQRVELLKVAIQDEPRLQLNTYEVNHSGASYTIDTLKALRQNLDPHTPLCLILGVEQFSQFHQWQQWQAILTYAHLIVTTRA